MITTALAGCFGTKDDVVTNEGDEVVLENTDDWPTYYVATANDLPTCPDDDNSGKLYYVEDVAEFKACTSTGWVAVQIGGNGANLLMNQPPVIGYSVLGVGDEEVDNVPVVLVAIGWSIIDVDGTVQSMGLDNNSDGVIDAPFPTQEGFGYIESTPEIIMNRHTEMWDYDNDGVSDTMCYLKVFWAFNVIAVDDDGASTIERYQEYVDSIDNEQMQNSELGEFFDGHLADVDWMLDNASCMQEAIPKFSNFKFSVDDHGEGITSGDSDALVSLSFAMAPSDLSWSDLDIGIIVNGEHYQCSPIQGIDYPCFLEQDGENDMVWELGEDITIFENGENLCEGGWSSNEAGSECLVEVNVQNAQTGYYMDCFNCNVAAY